jgi:hypothetical protein
VSFDRGTRRPSRPGFAEPVAHNLPSFDRHERRKLEISSKLISRRGVRVALGLPASALAFLLLVQPAAAKGRDAHGRDAEAARPGSLRPSEEGSAAWQNGGARRPSPATSLPSGEQGDHRSYVLESGPVSFGDVVPGVASELPAAIRVRVFSDRRWSLNLVAASPLVLSDRSEAVSPARLAWRTHLSGGFVDLAENRSATIARGSRTGGAGELVVVDLRLRLAPEDEIGRYNCEVRLFLDDP